MPGETTDRHPGEHARPGSPPGWYADPIRDHSLRRWDGAHWTADVDPAAAVVDVQPSAKRHPLNWPVLVGFMTVFTYQLLTSGRAYDYATENYEWAKDFIAETVPGTGWLLGQPVLVLLGLLGARRQYSSASRMAAVALLILGCLGLLAILALLIAFETDAPLGRELAPA